MGVDDADAKPRPRPRPVVEEPAEEAVDSESRTTSDDNGAVKRRKLGRFFDTGDGEATVVPRPIPHFPGVPLPDPAKAEEPERPRPSPGRSRPRPSAGQ